MNFIIKNFLPAAILITICAHWSNAQTADLTVNPTSNAGINVSPRGALSQFSTQGAIKAVEEVLLYDSWAPGTIYLNTNEVVESFPVNVDVLNKKILVQDKERVLEVPIHRIDSLVTLKSGIKRTYYPKLEEFTDAGPAFYLAQVEADFAVYTKYEAQFTEPSYNPVLGVGSKEFEAKLKEKIYFRWKDFSGEVPKRKNAFIEMFPPDKQREIKEKYKSIGVNLKNPQLVFLLLQQL